MQNRVPVMVDLLELLVMKGKVLCCRYDRGGEDEEHAHEHADFGFVTLERPYTLKSFAAYADWVKALHFSNPPPKVGPPMLWKICSPLPWWCCIPFCDGVFISRAVALILGASAVADFYRAAAGEEAQAVQLLWPRANCGGD